jgi:hypothetical protein
LIEFLYYSYCRKAFFVPARAHRELKVIYRRIHGQTN